jgi:hypothetical protein
MTLIKKNSSGSTLWTNVDAEADFMANPANGGGTGEEMVPANIDFEGCSIIVSQKDAVSGNLVQIVKCTPGDLAFEGVVLTPSGSSLTVPLTPGDVAFEGVSQTPGHTIVNTPGDLDFEGTAQIPGHTILNTPGNLAFEGLSFPTLQGLNVTIPVVPGNIDFEGVTLTPYNALTGFFSRIITNTPGDLAFAGVEITPGGGFSITPGDFDFEGVTLTPGHGVIGSPGNIDFEGIEQRPMFYVPSTIQKKKFYTCTLTGTADGTTDVVLPVSSISIRLRNGEPTYCGVVVPNVGNNETYINDRLNGQLVIYRGFEYTDGGQSVAEICRVDLEATPYDQGVRKSSFQLSGHITVSNGAPSTFDIRPIQTMSVQSDGARRVRSQPQFFLRSGDTVIYGDAGESFTAGLITISVDTNLDRMEVTEYIP